MEDSKEEDPKEEKWKIAMKRTMRQAMMITMIMTKIMTIRMIVIISKILIQKITVSKKNQLRLPKKIAENVRFYNTQEEDSSILPRSCAFFS